ncbi:MAG TPA: ABC transporter ATP-binding protein [Candidatus Acidoferrales bacterium]|nr:ABC transporter ATP-binding protein [Candidatus Acidoferrales bacterium]
MSAAVELHDVHKRYRVYHERYFDLKEVLIRRRFGEWEDRWALRGVSFQVEPGHTFGLIGPNGAGKSTTLKLIARILEPESGQILTRGRVAALIELGAGFQWDYTGRENVQLNASLLGLSRREIARRFQDIVDFAELGEHIDAPLRTYSSGMYMRLGFSVAVHVDPEVMLVDEVLAVGDEAFQQKCFDWLEGFQGRGGTIVLVSHDLQAVREVCTEAAWIEEGKLRERGAPNQVVDAYLDNLRAARGKAAEAEAAPTRDLGGLPALSIGEVRLLDRRGGPADLISTGDPLAVEINYRVNRRLDAAFVGVLVHRNDGLLVASASSAQDGFRLEPGDRDGAVRLDFPQLPLLAGSYRISVAFYASAKATEPVDSHPRRYGFRVVGSGPEEGVVRLPHRWSFEEAASPSRLGNPAAGQG